MEIVGKLADNKEACDRVVHVYTSVLKAMPGVDPQPILERLGAQTQQMRGNFGPAFERRKDTEYALFSDARDLIGRLYSDNKRLRVVEPI